MKRTFFAVKISEKTKKVLLEINSNFPEFKEKFKIQDVDNSHLTIKFLGETQERDINKIDKIIRLKICDFEKFTFECEKTGCFPNPKNVKVLWLGINKGLIKLQSLHNLVKNCIRGIECNSNERKFIPHITFGRIKRSYIEIESLGDFLNFKYNPIKNEVDELIWFESIFTPIGVTYKVLRKYKLK